MTGTVEHVDGTPVLMCAAGGEQVRGVQDALDILGTALHLGARWAVVPAGRLEDGFFRLSTGLAGDILQKFVNYRVGLVILGDISRHTEASAALRSLVAESNRGGQAWFLPDLERLRERLARIRA